MLGIIWYFSCIAGAFVYLVGSSLAEKLTFTEIVAASIPLGTVIPAYITFGISALISSLG
jgi:hypothetical protein